MSKNPPDERSLYLALKSMFRGADAGARMPKDIRELIVKRQNDDTDIRDLIKEHDIDEVCHVAKELLGLQIFERK